MAREGKVRVWFTQENHFQGLCLESLPAGCVQTPRFPWCEETPLVSTSQWQLANFSPMKLLFLETTVIYMLGPIINCSFYAVIGNLYIRKECTCCWGSGDGGGSS